MNVLLLMIMEQEGDNKGLQEKDKWELELYEIEKAVNNLMEMERTFMETDLILKIRALVDILINNNNKEDNG